MFRSRTLRKLLFGGVVGSILLLATPAQAFAPRFISINRLRNLTAGGRTVIIPRGHLGMGRMMMMGGYGMGGYGGGGSYGMGSGYGSSPPPMYRPAPSYAPPQSQRAAAPSDLLNWPVGLRVLGTAQENTALRRAIEADVQALAQQAAYGQMDERLVEQTQQSVAQLGQRLSDAEGKLSAGTVREARRFLAALDAAVRPQQ